MALAGTTAIAARTPTPLDTFALLGFRITQQALTYYTRCLETTMAAMAVGGVAALGPPGRPHATVRWP